MNHISIWTITKIFLFIIFIIILYNIYFNIFETFTNSIYFLTKKETQTFIQNDDDEYIKNLSIYDLRARKAKTNNDYLKIALDNCLDFNKTQKEKLSKCSIEANKYFNNNNFNWNFSLINVFYEEGFPHTRSKIIFLSPNVINYDDKELLKILIHERIHIYQRFNKKEINKYLNLHGFSVSRIKNKNSLIRANPDLDNFIYKDINGNELVAYYNSKYPKGINDINLNISSNEHPFEKMAYEFNNINSLNLLI